MIAWLNIMDIGLSAGLRNKLTEAITLKDKDLAKSYVSTTYALLSFMALGGLLVCTLLIFFLDWRTILTIPKDLSYGSFEGLLCIVAISFFISFLLKPISGVAYATHKPETEYFILFISNLINILLIWGVSFVYPGGGLLTIALLFCFTPILITLLLSVILYNGAFRDYKPSLKFIRFEYAKALTGLSIRFFIIQISATVVFTTNNFIISHYFGNDDVTKYNIVSKYFNVLIILQSMILVPFWTYFTEAFVKNDQKWLQEIMSKLLKMGLVFVFGCIIMTLISGLIYKLWLGDLVNIPISLTIVVGIFTCLTLYAAIFSTFLNGTGRIKLQMYTSLIPSILHIPLTVCVIKFFNFGILGVVGVSSFWLLITLPLRYLQYKKIVSFKPTSKIWIS